MFVLICDLNSISLFWGRSYIYIMNVFLGGWLRLSWFIIGLRRPCCCCASGRCLSSLGGVLNMKVSHLIELESSKLKMIFALKSFLDR